MSYYVLVTPAIEDNKIYLSNHYLSALKKVDLIPIIVGYEEDIEKYIHIADGILLSGGGDISAEFLDEAQHPLSNNIHLERDTLEIKLCQLSQKREIPLLGICRGMQIMNVALGGNIVQHIESHIQDKPRDLATHYVILNYSSKLCEILEESIINVNSFHHQVVNSVGENLFVSGNSEDDYIEAIEGKKGFYIGVQWHPETLTDKYSNKLFKAFAEAINNNKKEGKNFE